MNDKTATIPDEVDENAIVAGMTDEEREAYLGGKEEDAAAERGEPDEDDGAAADAAAASPDGGADESGTKANTKVDADAEADAEADADGEQAKGETDGDAKADAKTEDEPAAAKADAKADAEAGSIDVSQIAPAARSWQSPTDAKAQLDDIAAQKVALAERFDSGEITAKEWKAQEAELDAKAKPIEQELARAEVARTVAVTNWFENTVPAFLAQHRHYSTNEALWSMLNEQVKVVQAEAAKAGRSDLDPKILEIADQRVRDALSALTGSGTDGGTKTAKTAKTAKVAAKSAATDTQPGGGKPIVPPNLGKLPAADATETDSQFAALDRLDGVEYEEAFGRLTDAQREAYLASRV